jgi:hypothetical protein
LEQKCTTNANFVQTFEWKKTVHNILQPMDNLALKNYCLGVDMNGHSTEDWNGWKQVVHLIFYPFLLLKKYCYVKAQRTPVQVDICWTFYTTNSQHFKVPTMSVPFWFSPPLQFYVVTSENLAFTLKAVGQWMR